MKKQWKRLAALLSAAVMAAGTLLYFPTDTLQNISWGITASAEETGTGTESGTQTWNEDNLTWTLTADGTMTISGEGAMKNYFNDSPACNNKNIKKVVIEDGITSIGASAFLGYRSLTSITIPSSVTSIGDVALSDCTSLTNITIPESVTSIGDATFQDCSGLTSIEIPSNVESIGELAFSNCTVLTSITIPKSVASIGKNAFDGCTDLKEVLLENGSTLTSESLGVDASIIKTYWNEGDLTWTLTADGTLTISGKGAMKNYDANNSPVAQKTDSVKKVVIQEGVTSIGDYAFFDCSNLTDITIPESVTSIEECAFQNCSSLTDITIPGSVTSIGEGAFQGCSSLTSIEISSSVTSIGDDAFYGTPWLTNKRQENNSLVIVNGILIDGRTCSGEVTIPDSVTSIGYRAFQNCTGLTSITIPKSVTSIGDSAFYNCTGLTSINIPEGVTSIGKHAFFECAELTSIKIPSSVTSIGDCAFSACNKLPEITVPCDSTLTKKAFGDASEKVKYRHSLVKTDAKDATYTEAGNVEYWTCENCKKHFLTDETDTEAAKEVELSEIVKPVPVQVATATTQIKCVYGQDMDEINLQDYVKNADAVGGVSVKVTTGSTMLDGMQLDGSKLSGKPKKVYTDGKDVTFTFTAKNGNTADLTLHFLVAKADTTVEVTVDGDSHTEGDLVSELKLILSGNNTKGLAEIISEIKALAAGENTLTWKFTPEDSENYNVVTGTVVVNAQTATKATTATSRTTSATKATTVTSGTTATTKATATTNETTATTEETTTTNETSATTEETTTTNETTATTEETTTINETTVTTEETTTNGTTATTEETTTTSETSATTGETTTNETTATIEETTTNETTSATKATTATSETTATTKATTATSGTTFATQTTTTTKESTTASETTMTTSASSTESTAATSATTITTAATTSVTNIADEDLCSWAINDYQKKAGIVPANAEITARSEETCEITLTDENGNVLDIYTVDPKTGTGTDSSNAEVNLPQTGNNSMTNWLLCVGAAMFMAFGFGAVKASGIFKRKEDE